MLRKVALITGCSKGFGYMFALKLARAGYQVVATGRVMLRMQALKDQAVKEGLAIDLLELDVNRLETIGAVVGFIVEKYGRIDVLVNNAGYGLYAFFEDAQVREVQDMFQTNVFGLIAVTQAVLPIMKQQHGGHIVNISSAAVAGVLPMMGFYSATKWAVEAISEALYYELAKEQIKVSLIQPGPFKTEFSKSAVWNADTENKDSAKMRLHPPFKEDPEKVAELLLKIVQNKSPKLRYPVGYVAKAVFMLRKIFPQESFVRVQRWLLSR
ncbi:MAG: SDR family oxidoreductase [Candidatus Margulisiibacteriota bacterium]|jgi:short-subunit dehydrogenase